MYFSKTLDTGDISFIMTKIKANYFFGMKINGHYGFFAEICRRANLCSV